MYRLILSALLIIMFITNADAQSTATATTTATIVAPIFIGKTGHMNFGNLSVQAGIGGTVVLAPNGTRTRTNGVTLPAAGTVSPAVFDVDGTLNYTYAITLPSTVILTRTSGFETMPASTFSSPSNTGVLAGGQQTINVDATLTVAAGQAAGVYTSGDFDVTVNHN